MRFLAAALALTLAACGTESAPARVLAPTNTTTEAPAPTTTEASAPTTTTTTEVPVKFFGREPSVDWYGAGRADMLVILSYWDESELGWLPMVCAYMVGARTAEGRVALEAVADDEPEVWESTEEEPNAMAAVYESADDVPDDVLDGFYSGASDVVCEAAGTS